MPEIADLKASYEGNPGPRRSRVAFVTGVEIARPPCDHAMGGLCRVIRTDEQANIEEATGAVVTNSLLTVSLDGKGWTCIYLRFEAVTDAQRNDVLARLKSTLSEAMTLFEPSGGPCIRVEGQSDDAAVVAVDRRLARIRSELGLQDDQLSCGLGSRL